MEILYSSMLVSGNAAVTVCPSLPQLLSLRFRQVSVSSWLLAGAQFNRGLVQQRPVLVLVEQSKQSQGQPCIATRSLWESGKREYIKTIHLFPVPLLFCYSKAFFIMFCSFNFILCLHKHYQKNALKRHPKSLASLYPGLLG